MLLYYQYGSMPPRPDQVVVVQSNHQPHSSGLGSVERLTLEIDSVKKLQFHAALYRPHQPGRHPVIIREEGTLGRAQQVPMFLEKGYIFIEYARHDLDPDQDGVVGSAQAAYPEHDWATLAVWAWCGMRLVDYLETRDDVDLARIGITGHSRGGKMALLAGALDERFSLVAPHQSGAGGAGCYRILGPGAETLAQNDKPHWYHERLRWFGEREERLPFDQHSLKALVAPRALLCTESVDDEFANPLGTLATSVAAQEVFEFLVRRRRTGFIFAAVDTRRMRTIGPGYWSSPSGSFSVRLPPTPTSSGVRPSCCPRRSCQRALHGRSTELIARRPPTSSWRPSGGPRMSLHPSVRRATRQTATFTGRDGMAKSTRSLRSPFARSRISSTPSS